MIISIFDPHVSGINPEINILEWNSYKEKHKAFLRFGEYTFPCSYTTIEYIYVGY